MFEQKVTLHSAASATAAGTEMYLTSTCSVAVQVTGTWVGTVTWQATIDNSNWVAVEAVNTATGIWSSSATANGLYVVPVNGYRRFRAYLTWSSGTSITATAIGVEAAAVPFGHSPGPYGQSLATKALTFANTTAAQTLFTVTGDVVVRLVPICKTNLASTAAGSVALGVTGYASLFMGYTLGTDIDANEFWADMNPGTTTGAALAKFPEYVLTNGVDILLTPSAQIDSGAITFYCFWTPLSAGATVV